MIRGIFRPMELQWKSLLLAAVPLREDFLLVTGSDRTHSKSLGNLLRSLAQWEPHLRCIFYDLGLERGQRKEFSAAFPSLEVRRFDYSKYSAYFDIRVNAGSMPGSPSSSRMSSMSSRAAWPGSTRGIC